MQQMTEVELANVENLTIGREGFGKVRWFGTTDVRGLDFDELVDIGAMACTIRPGENLGEKRNILKKPCIVCLYFYFGFCLSL